LDPRKPIPDNLISLPELRIEDGENHAKFARAYLEAGHNAKIAVFLLPVVGRKLSIWYIYKEHAEEIRQRLRAKWKKEAEKAELQKKQSELEFKPKVKGSLYPSRPDIGQFSSDEKVEVLNYLANVRRGLDQVIDYLTGVTPQNPQHDSEKAEDLWNPPVVAGGTPSVVFAAPPPAERDPSDSDKK